MMKTINNKYLLWYNKIIERAKCRVLSEEIYTEKHHIIPRSLGGTDVIDNLVTLTAREHYICHLLLTHFLTGQDRYKMICAVQLLMNDKKRKYNSHLYKKVKADYSNIMKEKMKGNIFGSYNKGRIGTFTGRSHTDKTKQLVSKNRKGKGTLPKSIETRKKMSENNARFWLGKPAWNKGKKGCYTKSLESKIKVSRAVTYNGVRYYSILEAARQNNTSEYKIKKSCTFDTA